MAPARPSLSSLAGPHGFPKDSFWGIPPPKKTWAPGGFSKANPGRKAWAHEDFQANPGRMLRSASPPWRSIFRAKWTSLSLHPLWPKPNEPKWAQTLPSSPATKVFPVYPDPSRTSCLGCLCTSWISVYFLDCRVLL